MTVVGKILVFLNLVFSLVVGGFAVMDYTARTHWSDAYQKYADQNKVLRAMNEATRKESEQLAKEKADLYNQFYQERVNLMPIAKDDPAGAGSRAARLVLDELKSRTTQMQNLQAAYDKLQKDLNDERAKMSQFRASEKVATIDIERRQQDSVVLRQQVKDLQAANADLVKEKNDLRDEMVQAKIKAQTFKERNTQLESALRQTQIDLAQAKVLGTKTGGASGVNPPPDNVEGLVKRAEGNLVTISLGSDAGLARGQTMEVFRLGQNAKYIGRIRLVEVTPVQAVGQAMGKLSVPIQTGDRVASRIVAGN